MNLFEGVIFFLFLMLFYYIGYKNGQLNGMEYQLWELTEELNDDHT